MTHQVPSRALDEAVWAEVRAFLGNPDRGRQAAHTLAKESEARMEVLAAQRVVLGKRMANLDEEAAELLRLGRRRTIRAQDLERSMAEVDEGREATRTELAALEAQIALAAQELPRAAEIERICSELADGLEMVTSAEERREPLESLAVRVFITGCDASGCHYTIEGIVPELTTHGTIALHTSITS
jgi:chromosome segregation ATPase